MEDYDNYVLGVGNSMHPANIKETEEPQVTIDESWYYELLEDSKKLQEVKKAFGEWYEIHTFPLEKTSDELLRMNELIEIIKKA